MQAKTDNLIAKVLSENATEEERAKLAAWLAECSENAAYYEDAKAIWQLSLPTEEHQNQNNIDNAWEEFRVLTDQQPQNKHRVPPVYIRAAAALFLLACSFVIVRIIFDPADGSNITALTSNVAAHADTFPSIQAPSPAWANFTGLAESPAGAGKKRRESRTVAMIAVSSEDSAMVFILPDNSKVYLNRNSKLLYPEHFGGSEHNVYLSGEAYFETENTGGSIFIFCHDVRTRMMGSAVNIKGLRDGLVEISAIEGALEVSVNRDSVAPPVHIKSGEQVVYDSKSHQVTKSKINRKDRWWRRGSFRRAISDFFNRIFHSEKTQEQ